MLPGPGDGRHVLHVDGCGPQNVNDRLTHECLYLNFIYIQEK